MKRCLDSVIFRLVNNFNGMGQRVGEIWKNLVDPLILSNYRNIACLLLKDYCQNKIMGSRSFLSPIVMKCERNTRYLYIMLIYNMYR